MRDLRYKGPQLTPSLSFENAENEIFDRDALMAEIELMDVAYNFAKTLGNSVSADRYAFLAEIYAQEYDNHLQDMMTQLHIDGAITEMYSDIYKYEKKNGETERSKYQKERLFILINGVETLKKYFTKYDQLKLIHRKSVIERHKLEKENQKLRKQLENIEKAENF